MSDVDQSLAPTVITTSNPAAEWLLLARTDIQNREDLQELFQQAREEAWTAQRLSDHLAIRLAGIWGVEHYADAVEVALFLADEFLQVGEGIHLVSAETGQIVAKLSEDDLYRPNPLPREGSDTLAVPMLQLKPEVAAATTMWTYEKHREAQLLRDIALRASESGMVTSPDDPKLRIVTRSGRSSIAKELSELDPKGLLTSTGGTAAAFLSHFEFGAPDSSEGLIKVEGVATNRVIQGIQDPHTFNLAYNKGAAIRGVTAQSWARDIARKVAEVANRGPVFHVDADDLSPHDLGDADFWVCGPNEFGVLRRVNPKLAVMPVEGSKAVGLKGDLVGYLAVPETFSVASHELFNRWELIASVPYELWVRVDRLVPLSVVGVVPAVEVL